MACLKSKITGKLINRIPGTRLLISSLPGSALRTHVELLGKPHDVNKHSHHSTQSGFRLNHSCETALLQMINKFPEAINNSQIIGMVMVDFRKAFDMVDH